MATNHGSTSTSVHIRPPPEMLLTVVFGVDIASAETKASSNSPLDLVEKVGLVTIVAGVFWSKLTVASTAIVLATAYRPARTMKRLVQRRADDRNLTG